MNPKKYMLLFFILCSLLSNAQGGLRIANIASVISTGMYEYAIVHEIGTSNYFKTSPATLGLLYQNRTVQIESTSDDADIVEIIDPEMDGTLFAKRIISSSDALLFIPVDIMPIFENNILFFESEAHLQEFVELLELSIVESGEELEIDQKLDAFENLYPGFVSFRKYFIDKYDLSNYMTKIQKPSHLIDFEGLKERW